MSTANVFWETKMKSEFRSKSLLFELYESVWDESLNLHLFEYFYTR